MIAREVEYKNILENCVLFQGVMESTVNICLNKCRDEIFTFSKGDLIYNKLNFKKSLGIVLDGSIVAVKEESSLIMSTKKVGEIFGAATLFQKKYQFVAEIRAAEKSKVLFLNQEILMELFQKDFHFVENYLCFLSERLSFLNQKIDGLTARSAESKVARLFLMNRNNQGRVVLGYNFTNIAKTLCIGRATLYRVIGDMEKTGLIQKDGKRIYVNKPELLERLI